MHKVVNVLNIPHHGPLANLWFSSKCGPLYHTSVPFLLNSAECLSVPALGSLNLQELTELACKCRKEERVNTRRPLLTMGYRSLQMGHLGRHSDCFSRILAELSPTVHNSDPDNTLLHWLFFLHWLYLLASSLLLWSPHKYNSYVTILVSGAIFEEIQTKSLAII